MTFLLPPGIKGLILEAKFRNEPKLLLHTTGPNFFFFLDEWNSIFGDFSKFGLGVLSIVIDVMYMFRHYVLYATRQHKRVSDDDRVVNDVTNYPVIT